MTRKHFNAMARSLRANRPDVDQKSARAQWESDVKAIAHVLSGTNPFFDFERFYAACGIEP